MGAPLGNRNGSKQRPFTDVLRLVLIAEDGKKLRALAERLVGKALEGDTAAAREVLDRLEGKPAQSVELAGDASRPLVIGIRDMRSDE